MLKEFLIVLDKLSIYMRQTKLAIRHLLRILKWLIQTDDDYTSSTSPQITTSHFAEIVSLYNLLNQFNAQSRISVVGWHWMTSDSTYKQEVSPFKRTHKKEARILQGPPYHFDETQVKEIFESQPWVESVMVLLSRHPAGKGEAGGDFYIDSNMGTWWNWYDQRCVGSECVRNINYLLHPAHG